MNNIVLELPLQRENALPLRLFVGGLCSNMNFDVSKTEDTKVAVNEAFLLMHESGYDGIKLEFCMNDNVFCAKVYGIGNAKKVDNEMSMLLLTELVEKVEFHKADEILKSIEILSKGNE